MQFLPSPPKQQLSYLYFGHASFAVSDGESLVIADPFFSGEFEWLGKVERQLEPATIPVDSIHPCHAVLVSHEHTDHWDAEAIRKLLVNTDCTVYAPKPALDVMAQEGIDPGRCVQVSKGMSVAIGELQVTSYPAVESDREDEPVSRVGYLIEYGGDAIFHQGDSHGPAKAWQEFKQRLTAMVVWPIYVDSYVTQMRPPTVIFHHMDRFEPGDFFCNKDPQREVDYWSYRYPETKFLAPERNVWLAVRIPKSRLDPQCRGRHTSP
ncbi:MAG: hypothetical protein AUJ92_17485 [Armatimonadetes bacterium CG2_30_59_28]|nr:MBL fold metallo-hydrolase [Armatimonadota bacterium]OIO90968.1 MAG: hypothetical protein AUJ92_17485 [Armatimonadetes bacterium CG2_30_59_28]PIU67165.1 MAG: hypothetical protein COS85_01800 [Armatimonadetes bacterium CG07_land_8_20_14_0_80_59_28]PIX38873.1 MAG: hypothetical protein COZ56_19300 [Armatimonadetes bacterium CG_4_8_14_3_um_filter_58_9]PIY38567.1 MAG: hypothetical protein COZ05_20625 [Armatimonadetes bacterium CG_4_10_14_3_um_filter_59_10]PJB71272.1 MAG: hypothetical protein CO0